MMAFVNWSPFSRRKRAVNHSQQARPALRRRLAPQIETLESRLMLTEITVNTAEDIVDGNYNSIAELISAPGDDGHISLREAVLATNRTDGVDRILFDSELDGVPIALSIEGRDEDAGLTGDLDITGTVIIRGNGTDGDRESARTIIDAGGIDRIFDTFEIQDGENRYNVALFEHLQLTGGRAEGDGLEGSGGAIRSQLYQGPNIAHSIVSENSTSGDGADGGGVWTDLYLWAIRSTISGNSTSGEGARGGGVFILEPPRNIGGFRTGGQANFIDSTISGDSTVGAGASGGGIFSELPVIIAGSTVAGNSTSGEEATGGGISAVNDFSDVLLFGSTIAGNSTAGQFASGGGISTFGNVGLYSIIGEFPPYVYLPTFERNLSNPGYVGNTVSGNSTAGDFASGGGIFADGDVTLSTSTISGNTTAGLFFDGGGAFNEGDVRFTNSTITGNSTTGEDSVGGGFTTFGTLKLESSIVAGNTVTGPSSGAPDFFASRSLSVNHSLIGDNQGTDLVEAQTAGADGNLIGNSKGGGIIDPLLGPLADNGGQTLTHGLLPGSPAIDAGNSYVNGIPDAYRTIEHIIDEHLDEEHPWEPESGIPPEDWLEYIETEYGNLDHVNPDNLSEKALIEKHLLEKHTIENPYDQRGEPDFARVIGDNADIGAFEGTLVPPVEAMVGDSNRDGRFDVLDLVQILTAAKFATGESATWEQGDWNGDGVFDVHDIVLALIEDNFESGVAATEAITPNAIDQYHREEETLSQSLAVEQDRIDTSSLLATGRRSRSREWY